MTSRNTSVVSLLAFVGSLVACATANGQVVISEVGYDVEFNSQTTWVELHNRGGASVNVAGFVLCNFPSYADINTLTVLDGSTTIPAGGFVVLSWGGLGVGDGEVGLYRHRSFTTPDSLVDYMEYGSAGHTRSGIARDAGLWDTGQFVNPAQTGESLARVNESGSFAERWASGTPSPGAANPTGTTVDDPAVAQAHIVGAPYPNPASHTVSIPITLLSRADISLSLYDVVGRRVHTSTLPLRAPGEHVIRLQTSHLSPGVYMSRVTSSTTGSDVVATSTFVVSH